LVRKLAPPSVTKPPPLLFISVGGGIARGKGRGIVGVNGAGKLKATPKANGIAQGTGMRALAMVRQLHRDVNPPTIRHHASAEGSARFAPSQQSVGTEFELIVIIIIQHWSCSFHQMVR
jgi:hypothetical protein